MSDSKEIRGTVSIEKRFHGFERENAVIYQVIVTDQNCSQCGKKLPVQSRYGRLKDQDEVLFEIIQEGGTTMARLVHPVNPSPLPFTKPGRRGGWGSLF